MSNKNAENRFEWFSAFLAPQKEFESPTFRLGGGRSILLSYWGIFLCIVPKFCLSVNLKSLPLEGKVSRR